MRAPVSALLLVALLAPPARGQSIGAPELGRQVITASALQLAGARRLGDILLLIDDWDVSSVDGFTWSASPHGLSSFERSSWTLMLDGQVVELNLFGVQSLDRLPVTLSQIDSVEVISAPALVEGVFIDGGLIRIHTHEASDGVSVRARFDTANETGDPGPFRFTELATPNIDRIGTGVAGGASVAGARGYVDLSARWHEHFVTDPLLRQRNFDITVGEFPIIRQSAVSLKAALKTSSGSHALFLGRSWTRDYFFLPQFGREVPVESPFNQAGVDGRIALTPTTRMRYRASYATNTLDRHDNALDLDFGWRLRRWRADVEVIQQRSTHRAALGFSVDGAAAETGYALTDDGLTLFRLHGVLAYRLAEHTDQTLAVQLSRGEGDLGLRAALRHRWSPRPNSDLEATVAWSERLPAEDGRIWIWQQRGYEFLTDAGVEVTRDSDLETARALTGDLRWRLVLAEGLSLRFGAYVRALSRHALDAQTFQFDSASQAFAGPVSLRSDQEGELGGAELAAAWVRRSILLRSYYRFQDVLAGSRGFREAWRAVPRHRLTISALYTPWRGLELGATIRYRSPARWAAYRLAAEQSGGRYRSEVADALSVDVAVQKWLWKRRFRAQLLLHNVLNDAVPYHPIGAAYDLTFAVQGELLLEGL